MRKKGKVEKIFCAVNLTRRTVLAENIKVAAGPLNRLRGLLGKKNLPSDGGLLIIPCQAVHTFFMHFPIDVVFLDEGFAVVGVAEGMPPFRVSPFVRGALAVLELPAGTVRKTGTLIGDRILLRR